MAKPTDIQPIGAELYFLPVTTRVPLKFGAETLTEVTCARVRMTVQRSDGETFEGWGETPLSVQWVWPSKESYDARHRALQAFCMQLTDDWARFAVSGHALEVGHRFIETALYESLDRFNAGRGGEAPMPQLAALVCCSAFDIALHDAFGQAADKPVYQTYTPDYLSQDLASMIEPAIGSDVGFAGRYPDDYLLPSEDDNRKTLAAWHLVGGLDLLESSECTGDEPADGYPVALTQWLDADGLRCLKVKLRGNDIDWDYARLVRVGTLLARHVDSSALPDGWLTADFNCNVTDPAYVNDILGRLCDEQPRLYGMLLYVEQPFPYDLEANQIDVHSVSARKPLFMDESAHDWRLVRLGRSLGWSGVALKTCKTQTGALLSACWAKAHGMTLMVQDLTNPMLAQISHVQLAKHVGTIMGVETNAMQFYPEASAPEASVHPGLYRRRGGCIDLSTISGPGFGYRLQDIQRRLPEPVTPG